MRPQETSVRVTPGLCAGEVAAERGQSASFGGTGKLTAVGFPFAVKAVIGSGGWRNLNDGTETKHGHG